MNIYSIDNASPILSSNTDAPKKTVGEMQQSFAMNLKEAIEHINHAQHKSNQKTTALATGEIDDLHEVMITAQKASITLQTGVQVQKKVIDAYNEIMRLQV